MGERSFYVLAYDISDDRRRAKIARAMETVADRVQGSVFEAYLTPVELERLLRQVQKVLDLEADTLRVYLLCESCRPKLRTLGVGKATPPPGLMIV